MTAVASDGATSAPQMVPQRLPLPLSLHLARSIVAVLAATLALGSLLIYWHAVRKVETEMRAAIAVGSRIAGNAIDDGEEISNPRRRLELLVADFNGDRHLRAFYIDPSQMVALASRLQPPEAEVPEWMFRLLSGAPKIAHIKLPPAFKGIGGVMLKTDARNEVGEVWNDAKLYLMILATFCAVAMLLLMASLNRALRPLVDLTQALARIGRGDYSTRVPSGGSREILALEDGFNDMARRLADMEQQTARLNEQLEIVQDEERIELARNLHDEVSPLLFTVEVDAMTIRGLSRDRRYDELDDRARAIEAAVAEIKSNVKILLGQLRPSSLASLGLASGIESLANHWRTRVPEISFTVDVPPRGWGRRIDTAIYNIIRESLANAVKHGSAKRICVRVSEAEVGEIRIEVSDDGGGLGAPSGGYGVVGMRERAEMLGGWLQVEETKSPAGVAVRASLPLSRADAGRAIEMRGSLP